MSLSPTRRKNRDPVHYLLASATASAPPGREETPQAEQVQASGMLKLRAYLLVRLALLLVYCCRSEQLSSEGPAAVSGLLQRLLPPAAVSKFALKSNPACALGHQHCFRVWSDGSTVQAQGSTGEQLSGALVHETLLSTRPLRTVSFLIGTELAAGVHAWLEARCNSSISWDVTGGPHLDYSCFMPDRLQAAESLEPLYGSRSVPHFYYFNVVTAR